jgi:hypothetical protein
MIWSEYLIIKVSMDLESVSDDTIFEKLYKIESYSNWWSIPIAVTDFNNRILKFTPIRFIEILWKQSYDIFQKKITCEYIGGPLIGYGIWTITSKNTNKVHVSYEIKVKGRNLFFDILMRTPFFKYKHSKDILKIIQKASE